jgi:hypothetical protein
LADFIQTDDVVDQPCVWIERMRAHGEDHAFARIKIMIIAAMREGRPARTSIAIIVCGKPVSSAAAALPL